MPISLLIISAVIVIALAVAANVRRRYYAAMNVLMARYTFDRLPRPEQETVKEEAKSMVQARRQKAQGYAHDVERFGWYALAMKTLKIASQLPENPNWYAISNPTKALKKDDMFLRLAKLMVRQNYGVEIDMK